MSPYLRTRIDAQPAWRARFSERERGRNAFPLSHLQRTLRNGTAYGTKGGYKKNFAQWFLYDQGEDLNMHARSADSPGALPASRFDRRDRDDAGGAGAGRGECAALGTPPGTVLGTVLGTDRARVWLLTLLFLFEVLVLKLKVQAVPACSRCSQFSRRMATYHARGGVEVLGPR